jgi:hypothetical protein
MINFITIISSLCFATDENGHAVENFCNTLFKCIYYKREGLKPGQIIANYHQGRI